jgi:hypothetical protein
MSGVGSDELDDSARRGASERLVHLEAAWRAYEAFAAFDELVSACASRDDAIEALSGEPFFLSYHEADWILDMPLSTRTAGWREHLRIEIDQLRALLGDDR